ncbi:T9SS type A sorting domain-containing protein [Emticicia sp. CRIBPO]|uniref:Ig-like domain-containing protein n=1 Tax=Emticicia sp. CRIBPO TaxID=2683258 RepID=UPI00141279F9|nr:immunoglobulin domain-containing protein [Emticicia sp. CRIBPO]NBA85609.1 T9SS type A sorting domain-containing protein [Emticicia sp. CRIBPO]
MNRLYVHIVWLFLVLHHVSAQTGTSMFFTSNLTADKTYICPGGSVKLSAAVSGAAYFQFQFKEAGQSWQEVSGASGDPKATSGNISLDLSDVNSLKAYRVMITDSSSSDTLFSNESAIFAQKTEISIQPQSLTQCNGSGVEFRASASSSGPLTYQWQILKNGGFTDLATSSKIPDVNSGNLKVNSLTNAEHGSVYRCRITDQGGCTTYTHEAGLFVNQLSTTIQPTLSHQFCEGDNAEFFPASVDGEVLSYQWLMKSGGSSYNALTESDRFIGVNNEKLTVKGILPSENAFQVKVNFKNVLQGPGGNLTEGTCLKTAARTAYVINPRPEMPAAISPVERCGPGTIHAAVQGTSASFFWYDNPSGPPLASSVSAFDSPVINTSNTFYVSSKDDKGCESLKREFNAMVHTRPAINMKTDYEACPGSENVFLEFNTVTGSPAIFSFTPGEQKLTGFNTVVNQAFTEASPLPVSLPVAKTPGDYNFYFQLKDPATQCTSDSLKVHIKINDKPFVTKNPLSQTLCEENTLKLTVEVSGGGQIRYQWMKDNQNIAGQNSSELIIHAVQLQDAGQYRCEVSSDCGSDTSGVAVIKVLPKIQIHKHPQDQQACEGGNVAFNINATGSVALHYQWMKNGQAIGTDTTELVLGNLAFADNNAEVWCEIKDACDQVFRTNPARISVLKLPEPPGISGKSGYCKGEKTEALTAIPAEGNLLKWYTSGDQGSPASETPFTPDSQTAGKQYYFVSQTDLHQCESKKAGIEITISAPLTVKINPSISALCATGNLNRKAQLFAEINTETGHQKPPIYSWKSDSLLVNDQNTGKISINTPGKYEVTVKQGFCTANAEIQLNSIHPELNTLPLVSDTEVCPGGTATLTASGGESFRWWDSETGNNHVSEQNPFMVSHNLTPSAFYVSYVKTSDNVTCEGPRKKVSIGIIPHLNLSIALEKVSCPDKSDGKISIKTLSGKAPFMFSINSGLFKNDGEFTGLITGNYQVSVKDSNSCITTKDTTLTANPLPEIQTQPLSQADCKGNAVDFTIVASGYTSLQWQKKLPGGSFEDIPGENQNKLKISQVGSEINPEQTIFRVVLFTSHCQIFSEEAKLSVNSITGTLTAKTVCEGTGTEFNLNALTISGKAESYLWQFRAGTSGSWENIDQANQPTLNIQNCKITHQGYYRCRIIFDNGNGSTCTAYSSTNGTKLTVIASYVPVLSNDTTLCSPQEIQLNAGNCPGKIVWSTNDTGPLIKVTPKDSVNQYTASCEINGCTTAANDQVIVRVLSIGLNAPVISLEASQVCKGEPFRLSASACQGKIVWSNGLEGQIVEIKTDVPLDIYAHCHQEGCISGRSNVLNLIPPADLKPGEISGSNAVNCAGFNPPEITNVVSPAGGKNQSISWELSETCVTEGADWKEIAGAHNLTFNPAALTKTTCYRRKVADSCHSVVYSNFVKVLIQPDPVLKTEASKAEVCADEPVNLKTIISGGTGNCQISWQMNEKSGSESSSYWVAIPGTDSVLNFSDWKNSGQTVYFRSVYVCELSSCNKSTSPSVGVYVRPSIDFSLNVQDTALCSGNFVDLKANNCGGQIRWSTGDSTLQIRVYPTSDQTYKAVCSSICGEKTLSVLIKVIEGVAPPVNTTPTSVIQPAPLHFSGTGQNLRWYTSETDMTGFTNAPLHTAPGVFSYWLSQTIGECQSPKIKITAALYPVLSVIQQPSDQLNCEGNMVTFKTTAEGAAKLVYQWQRKRPGENEFVSLTDEMPNIKLSNTSGLKVYSTGNKENPDLSQYRCIITDSVSQIITAAAILKVNGLTGNFPDFKICTGKSFSLDLKNHFVVTGSVKSYQWQYRYGSADDWQNMKDDDNISGAQTDKLTYKEIRSWDAPRYRCQVIFSSDGLECIENTDQSTLTIGAYPPDPVSHTFDFCQYEKISKLDVQIQADSDPIWYGHENDVTGTDKMPLINTNFAGEQVFYLSQVNNAGCQSHKALIRINVHQEPSAPKNTTPAYIYEGQNLIFSAEGENLKWFTSKTGKTFQSNAPIYQAAKTYRHFVSQTSSYNCESERTEITAIIKPSLGFATQPKDQTDCDGNSVTFTAKTKGEEEVSYQWQRKRPGEAVFSDMPGENLKDLKILKIGNDENPHLSLYRCYIKDSRLDGMSNEVVLKVNEIKGTQVPVEVCDNQYLNIDTAKLGIIGEPKLVEWQKKEGSTYKTIFSTQGLSLNEFLKTSDQGDYRLKINFKIDEKSTCSRNTNTFRIKVNPAPEAPNEGAIEVCQFEKPDKIQKIMFADSNKLAWYLNETDTLERWNIPSVNMDSVYRSAHYLSLSNSFGCESKRTRIEINVKPSPKAPKVSEEFTYCLFSVNEAIKAESELPVLWYSDTSGTVAKGSLILPETSKEGKFTYAIVSKDSINGCESKRQLIIVNVEPCYYQFPQTNTGECQEIRLDKVAGKDWHYLIDPNARIVAAIHPEGQNLEQVTLSFTHPDNQNYFETDHGTRYVPRYYHFKSSSQAVLSKPVKIRLFISDNEISDYPSGLSSEEQSRLSIVNYIGVNEDCQLKNNDNFELGESTVLKDRPLIESIGGNFSMVEFSTFSLGEFGATENIFSESNLKGGINEKNKTELSLNKINEVRPLKYLVYKSNDQIKWTKLGEMSSENTLNDPIPYANQTHYQLFFTDQDGTRKALNTISVKTAESKPVCFVFPNPVESTDKINLYLNNFETTSLKINDALGRDIPVDHFNPVESYQQIKLKNELVSGVYIVTALNKEGKKCQAKFVK